MDCETDFDCPSTLVCYKDVSWDERERFCDCSTYYGWENLGSNCTDFGPQTRFYLSTASILLVVALPFVFIAIYDMKLFFDFPKARTLNKGVVTFIYCTLGLVSQVALSMFQLGSVSSPEDHVNEDDFGNEKLALYGFAERIFGMLGITFVFLSSLNISLVWLELSTRIKSLSLESTNKYNRIIYSCQAGFVLIVIIGVAFGTFYLSALIGLPYSILLLYLYKRGQDDFSKVLKAAGSAASNDQYYKLARLVKVTAIVVSVCMVGFFICASVFAALLAINWQEFSPAGSISLVVLFLQAAEVFVTVWIVALFWYSHINMRSMRIILSSSRKVQTSKGTTNMQVTSAQNNTLPARNSEGESCSI